MTKLTSHPLTLHTVITKDLRLGYRIERKKPWLTPAQNEGRLKFAREHIGWTEEEWKWVVWSDEMGMQIRDSHKSDGYLASGGT